MKFSVKITCGRNCRVGILSGLKINKENYETPFSLDVTKIGSIPHLTQDVYHDNFPKNSILCVPAQHFASSVDILQLYKKGAASFSALSSHPVCVVVQDPTDSTRGGYNDKSTVTVWDKGSRVRVSPQAYMELVEAVKPDWYETLNDADTDSTSSTKRILNSRENSIRFIQQCLDIHRTKCDLEGVGVFVPLLGGHIPLERKRMSESIANIHDVDGYTLLGLHNNGISPQNLDPVVLKNCVEASLEGLPKDKIRQAQGAFSLLSILELVECGVDIFDSSCACIATEKGTAMCFPNTFHTILSTKTDPCSTPNTINSTSNHLSQSPVDKETVSKKLKVECTDFSEDRNSADETSCPNKGLGQEKDPPKFSREKSDDFYEIDLIDKKYSESKEPLVNRCECYTCTTYTAAYVHHLLCVREMLANVLLMIHNLHHWNMFFDTIREAIKTKRFEELKLFFEQHSQKKKLSPKNNIPLE